MEYSVGLLLRGNFAKRWLRHTIGDPHCRQTSEEKSMSNLGGIAEALVTDTRARRIAIILCLGGIVIGGILALNPSQDQVNTCITVIGTLVTLAGSATALQRDGEGRTLPGKVVNLTRDNKAEPAEQDTLDSE